MFQKHSIFFDNDSIIMCHSFERINCVIPIWLFFCGVLQVIYSNVHEHIDSICNFFPIFSIFSLLVYKPVKITGSNMVVFYMLLTILNTLLITMQNALRLLF